MNRQLTRAIAAGAGIALLLAASALAKPKTTPRTEQFEAGNIVASDNGGITPQTLPRHKQAPISGHIHARFSTKDGSHMPALRHLTFDFDRTLQVDAEGLPSCSAGQLTARTTVGARRACPDAIVGSGSGEVEIEFPEQAPIMVTSPLVAFNGGTRGGKTVLYIHGYINVPTPAAVVAEATITNLHSGHYGMHTETVIPPIAGGAGSVVGVDLDLGRKYTYEGKSKSYLTASCPTGAYYIKGQLDFDDGTRLGVAHVFPCTPMR
jgi:hypothetical protein